MRHASTVAAALLLCAIAGGCGKQKPPPPPPPPPVHDLCLQGSPRLNWYDGKSHTLFVRIFQLSTVDAFAQADPRRLLDPAKELPGAEGPPLERTIYPDSQVTVSVTQRPDAQYLGIVAAYYQLDGNGKTYRPIAALGKGPCVLLGANAIEPEIVGPSKTAPVKK